MHGEIEKSLFSCHRCGNNCLSSDDMASEEFGENGLEETNRLFHSQNQLQLTIKILKGKKRF